MTIPQPAGVSAIVLAGGRSQRFGSDKLAALVDGETVLGRVVGAVASIAGEVILVAAPGVDPIPLLGEAAVSARVPLRLVHDPEPFVGPFVGLAAGLAAATFPLALVSAGDMPWLAPDVLRLLVDELAASDVASAVALEAIDDPGRLERFPVALRVAPTAAAAARLVGAGERRVSRLLDGLAVLAIAPERWAALDPDGLTVRDVDRVEDLDPTSRRPRGDPP